LPPQGVGRHLERRGARLRPSRWTVQWLADRVVSDPAPHQRLLEGSGQDAVDLADRRCRQRPAVDAVQLVHHLGGARPGLIPLTNPQRRAAPPKPLPAVPALATPGPHVLIQRVDSGGIDLLDRGCCRPRRRAQHCRSSAGMSFPATAGEGSSSGRRDSRCRRATSASTSSHREAWRSLRSGKQADPGRQHRLRDRATDRHRPRAGKPCGAGGLPRVVVERAGDAGLVASGRADPSLPA
jgi:hypothetical protein